MKVPVLFLKRKKYQMHDNVGVVIYSPYFKQNLIITHFKNDDNWLFVLEGSDYTIRAKTPFSYFTDKDLIVFQPK